MKIEISFFDLNAVKKEKAVKSQSKVSKSGSATLSLVIAPWLLLQSFNWFFFIESYLHSSFCFNISLQLLLVTFVKGFSLIALKWVLVLRFLKMPVNLDQYRVTVGIFNNRQIIIYYLLLFITLFIYIMRGHYIRVCQIICPTMILAIPH